MTETTRPSCDITVVTVVRNDIEGLRQTVRSVLDQSVRPTFIVVDGASTDGSSEFAHELSEDRVIVISEPDRGIYDAMNKAIDRIETEWLLFMNASDVFRENDSLRTAWAATDEKTQVVYSDVVFNRGGYEERVDCSAVSMRIHHQAMLYRRSLHCDFGKYLVAPDVTISDYIFMNCLSQQSWKKIDIPIATCDAHGVTSEPAAYSQKLAVDLIFGRKTALQTGAMLIVYPLYRTLIRPFVRLVSRISANHNG